MSRSIGDFMFKMNLNVESGTSKLPVKDSSRFGLSNEADIQELEFGKNDDNQDGFDMILMGCDGIWEGTQLPVDELSENRSTDS